MKEQHEKWYSQNLGRDIEMLVFGDRGYPVIAFPTSMGSYNQNKDFGLIDSAAWFVNEGLVKIYCVDGVDNDSWYSKNIHPADRAKNHIWYDKMLNEELVPRAMHETGVGKVAVAGCSFGGYHAVNFGFRHPEKTGYIFSMGGAFDIKDRVKGHYDDNIYFNNPPDFIPQASEPELWQMNIVLGTSENDFCKQDNIHLSNILNQKGIKHWLDIRPGLDHDWPAWKEMFPHYLSLIK